MGKLLRILSVFFLLLSIGAIVLAIMLFNKREILKGRTNKLETTLIELSPFIEEQTAEDKPNDFPKKDTSDVTARVMNADEITRSDFWAGYKLHLEDTERPVMNLGAKKNELMSYYLIDPITLKPKTDSMGYPISEGEGTMQFLLDDFKKRAQQQLARLNETREELKKVRGELVTTITELNERKQVLREKLAEIVRLNDEIAQLKDKIRQLEGEIADLKDQIRQLQDEIALQKQKIQELSDEIVDKNETIDRLRKTIDDLLRRQAGGDALGAKALFERRVKPGQKGKVVSVNREWNYAVIEISDEFIKEVDYINEILSRGLPQGVMPGTIPAVELLIKRGENYETFVTKVRLIQMKKDQKLGVADILQDWQQLPVQEGDIVFY